MNTVKKIINGWSALGGLLLCALAISACETVGPDQKAMVPVAGTTFQFRVFDIDGWGQQITTTQSRAQTVRLLPELAQYGGRDRVTPLYDGNFSFDTTYIHHAASGDIQIYLPGEGVGGASIPSVWLNLPFGGKSPLKQMLLDTMWIEQDGDTSQYRAFWSLEFNGPREQPLVVNAGSTTLELLTATATYELWAYRKGRGLVRDAVVRTIYWYSPKLGMIVRSETNQLDPSLSIGGATIWKHGTASELMSYTTP